jgi:hypothetical protein
MQVNDVYEHEDGSATLHFELTNEEVKLLLDWAIKEAIKNAIKLGENVFNDIR